MVVAIANAYAYKRRAAFFVQTAQLGGRTMEALAAKVCDDRLREIV